MNIYRKPQVKLSYIIYLKQKPAISLFPQCLSNCFGIIVLSRMPAILISIRLLDISVILRINIVNGIGFLIVTFQAFQVFCRVNTFVTRYSVIRNFKRSFPRITIGLITNSLSATIADKPFIGVRKNI